MDNLWKYVTRRDTTPVGCLEFITDNVVTLRKALTDRADFTLPGDSLVSWQCREKRASGALHFKHFSGWPQSKVQAHIDRVGLGFGGGWSPPVLGPIIMGPGHLADYCRHGWEDVFGIRKILLEQGWDQQPLSGAGVVWVCGAQACPGHKQPEDRCLNGLWCCGCRQPRCPGRHKTPAERCTTGSKWHCGARDCPTHSQPDHRCQIGVWYCGRKQPVCPGHSMRQMPCDSATVFLNVS